MSGLTPDEIVKCGSVTTVAGNCTGYTNVAAAGAEWSWDVTKDVWNNETDAVIQASCCVFKADLNTTCDALPTCEIDRVKLPAANTTSITGRLVSEAEPLCCEPAFTANDDCANSTVVCPVKFGAIAPVAGQLVNVSKTDLATQEEKCCAALPEYPVNATCADLNGPAENGTFLNCSDVSGYDFPFTIPAAARNGAPLDKNISGLNTIEALDECCMKVKYADGATCAANFNCTAVTPVAMAANTSNADVSLATVNIVDVEAAAALCCQPIVEDTVVPTTVAAWIADLEACKDVDLTKAIKVSGNATLVANSTSGDCPDICLDKAAVEVVVSGQCRYATFKPIGPDCDQMTMDAVGTVVLAEDKITSISGKVPGGDVEFTVAKVEGEPKQVTVTRGPCSAKYILDDVLLAKIEAAPKNSATGKAASFLAAVLALLAMLVL
ncbi:hypothetical protein OEZ85_011728 [Tetradesmus obliquus]|uniref:Pherophorin domain-containing protein n=1 Tax=Tetradesmus obliquus TaxID=3088 RepID=A0ABY8TRB2_TETOB|nr:hypothetical protein OEZ85_011728 [Tetradesmus obliquus]